MDLREYFRDLHSTEAKLQTQFPDGVVYVTSIYHRERNSKPGHTLSASWNNAARVITDGTHRISRRREVDEFLERQEANRTTALRAEQLKKQQYIVVVDPKDQSNHPVPQHMSQATFTPRPRSGGATAVAESDGQEFEEGDERSEE